MIENKLVSRKVEVETSNEHGHTWYQVTCQFQVLRKNDESDEPDIWMTFTGKAVESSLRGATASAISRARDLFDEHVLADD